MSGWLEVMILACVVGLDEFMYGRTLIIIFKRSTESNKDTDQDPRPRTRKATPNKSLFKSKLNRWINILGRNWDKTRENAMEILITSVQSRDGPINFSHK